MYTRFIEKPRRSSFLFGPRGVGKTTWLRENFPDVPYYDLLDTRLLLELTRDPNLLYRQLKDLEKGTWVIIDEVQKLPVLLNEIHRLIESVGILFLMTGSSALKLRRGGVNLLGGRASTKLMLPLVSSELAEDFDLIRALQYGLLPIAQNSRYAVEYLQSYVETYLTTEVMTEALIRNSGAFTRFVDVAARQNAEVINPTSIARDVGVNRRTVESHFQILIDTLMGAWLPAWQSRSSNREVQRSKFYFFDCGIVRAITQRVRYTPSDEESESLLETLVFHELSAYLAYRNSRFSLNYWRTYDGAEVDFVLTSDQTILLIEVKHSSVWRSRFNRGIRRFVDQLSQSASARCFGVYLGDQVQTWDGIEVLPISVFLQRLWDDELVREI